MEEFDEQETRYKIRSIIHNLGEQADMIDNLRMHLEKCLDKTTKMKDFRMCLEMVDSMVDISRDTHARMKELTGLIKKYEESLNGK